MNSRFDQFRAYHDGLEPERRRWLYSMLALTAAMVLSVGYWSSLTTWQPLMSGRSYEELLDAAAALDNQNVPYQLDNGELQVPLGQIGSARAALASSERLPGLEDVGSLRIGLTPQAQNWAFMRSKEGDLARMVNGITGVAASQVSIVPERESLFTGDGAPARASVFVRMRPGHGLDPTQVRAIVNMVAHAVDNLSAESVSLVDDRGHVLHEGGVAAGSSQAAASNQLLEFKQRLEQDHERNVAQALLPILGDETSMSVTATVELDMARTEIFARKVDNEAPAVLSEEMAESTSGAATPGGVPGVGANLPERGGAAAAGAQPNQQSESATDYSYPTSTEHRVTPAGNVRRMSVAVQVDAGRIGELAALAELEPAELQQRIEKAVQAAVGFDERRKDSVSVQFIPFAERTWVEGTEAATLVENVMTLERVAPWALAGMTVMLTFFMVVRPIMARLEPTKHEVNDNEDVPLIDPDADLAERLQTMVANFQPVDASDLNRLARRESTAAARVLRDWKEAGGGA